MQAHLIGEPQERMTLFMNKRIYAVIAIFSVIFVLAGCKKDVDEKVVNETEKMTVASEAVTLPTETIPEIDREDGVRETEPAVNKATIVEKTEEDAEDQVSSSSETVPAEDVGIPVEEKSEYEKLLAMSGEEQKAFMESFETMDDFFNWLDAAKAEYEAKTAPIEIGSDGVVNIG